jgi:hypothetical protein
MADGSYTKPESEEGIGLATLIDWFESSESTTQDERGQAERDRDYYDNKQLTAAEKAALARRGQPAIIVNRVKRKIDFLRGVESTQRSDPKAFPRNSPQDEQAAHAATDAVRYVCDDQQFQPIASKVWENLLIEGIGGVEVGVEQKRGRYEVTLKRYPWDRFFRDPHSTEQDFSDALYMGGVIWQDYDDAVREHPGAKEAFEVTMHSATHSDTYDDRPKYGVWADRARKRVRKVLVYYRHQGKWHWCLYTKGGKIAGGVSPYLDENGEPENPLIMTSAYVDRENRRYGVVREMIGPQDEINKRRSKALHLLSVRQVKSEKGAVDDVQKARSELAKPDGFVEVNPGLTFELLDTSDMAAAQFQLLQEAKNEIDMMGPNAAMEGKQGGDPSGRAIIAQQQGGYIELGPLTDALKQWRLRVYKAIWNRIRQFWTEERWVRVTDDERNIRFVGVNRPVTAGEAELRRAQESGLPPEDLQAFQAQLQAHPQANEIVGIENNLAEMDVDIIVDEAPDTVTIQAEQFSQIVELVKGGIPIPPDVLIEASQLRNKDQLLERMRAQTQPGPEQQAGMQVQLQGEQAKTEKTMAETEKTKAQTMEIIERIANPPEPTAPEPAAV